MNRQRLLDSLIGHEGIRNLPYEDTEGYLTIGIGHNLDNVPLSPRVIQMICEDDIASAEADLDSLWNHWKQDLSDARQNVIVEMVFNLGWTRFNKFVKFKQAIEDKDYDTAADEMLDSKWAKQVGRRAENLAKQMRTGQYYD